MRSLWQYKEVLVPYEDHRPEAEHVAGHPSGRARGEAGGDSPFPRRKVHTTEPPPAPETPAGERRRPRLRSLHTLLRVFLTTKLEF